MEIRAGQRYRADSDLEIIALTHWRAPFTGGHEVIFPKGEIFKVSYDPQENATAASCDAERYDALHERFIPPEDRQADKYDGYSLVIPFELIRAKASLVSE